MKKLFFLPILFLFQIVLANNLQVSNVSYSAPNITFTIQWDNSWNTSDNLNPLYPTNWDGAWVFIKYQNNIDNLWKHGVVSAISADHSVTGGVLQVDAVADGMGVFIRRTAPGAGNIASATVTLKVNALVGSGSFNFKVFGTEVVYIPQSDFQLGDGNVSGSSYFTVQDINSAKETSGIGAGTLFSGSPALPAAFPAGYNAMYAMKYEVTNEQWVDFLNTLSYDQQASRIDNVPNAAANAFAYANNVNSIVDNMIKIQTSGLNNTLPAVFGCDFDGDNVLNEANDGQTLACGIVGKADLYAFLDWSGLRPMTEIEFEKLARGTQSRVLSEYAWGTTNVVPHQRAQITNPGTANEIWAGVQSNGQAMANTGPGNSGPARSGIFANGSGGRQTAGAGFYGNMELSGNLWELCVMIDATGATFTGNNGNGTLTILGNADVSGWPSGSSNGGGNGTTLRGGSYYESASYQYYISVSGRNAHVDAGRSILYGIRGVRNVL